MDYQNYIEPKLIILIPVMYLIGIAIKKSSVKDKFIPLILGGISIVLCAIWIFASCETYNATDVMFAIFGAITQGILIAGTSVYINQIAKQSTKNDGDDDTDTDTKG